MTIQPYEAPQPAQQPTLRDQMDFATALAGASLLPRAYQNQPANVLLAIQTGYALGLPPMEAINSIHVIEGKPTLSADLMAALIRRAGHKLRITEEATADGPRVTASLVRADDPDFTFTVVWDRAKAKAANLHGKGNWSKYEGQMMRARAITELARTGASDVLHGVAYDPEELGGVPESGPATYHAEQTDTPAAPAVPPPSASLADLLAERDWRAEADDLAAVVDVAALYALHAEAKAAGASADDLAHIIACGKAAKKAASAPAPDAVPVIDAELLPEDADA